MTTVNEIEKLKKDMERVKSWEQRGSFKGCKTTHSADQVFGAAAQWTRIALDTEIWDYGAPFANGMHWSNLVCAGTVTKGIGGFTLLGVGTTFTTELAVGALVVVATEINVVTAITDNLNLTVQFAWGAAAAGSAYSRSNAGFVIPAKGIYRANFAAQLSVATDYIAIYSNQMTIPAASTIGEQVAVGPNAYLHCSADMLCNKFDFITFHVYTSNAVTLTSRWSYIAGCPSSPMASIVRIS